MSWIVSLLIVLGVILVSMILHELAHGVVAYWLGDDTAKREGRLTLNPLKHLDPVLSVVMPLLLLAMGMPILGGAKPLPINTRNLKHGVWGMALVAVAGPLTNILLAFVAFVIGYATGALMDLGVAGVICWRFITVNLGFGVFNLIPIPPLDGSRVLYALAPDGVRRVMEGMERWGIWVVMILVVAVPSVVSTLMSGAMMGILDGFYWIVNWFVV